VKGLLVADWSVKIGRPIRFRNFEGANHSAPILKRSFFGGEALTNGFSGIPNA